ncbi:MAG: 2-C-methyl-D-erythritol 2,4-cyclodiphosphate synthase [Bacteroidetes bacterium RBG_13_46_8]|nr:MAG: 2-C-methyl-D-erythritol 2,4-cyclodiphosphate synthase [Bacteroidetes bacterium RBG_13_46_8]
MEYRVGFGYDVHRLTPGRKLILGGIEIPNPVGCLAHSDGDVLIHAIIDALLGAAGLRDIGVHFPDTAQQYKGIDSTILLEKTIALLHTNGFVTGNIDATVCLQRPKLKDHIPQMREKMAGILKVQPDHVSVKATTSEGLGFTGREEGIAVYAVALIYYKEKP